MHLFASSNYLRVTCEVAAIVAQIRMWANAQRDGRPAEHRWHPLFNAAVWLMPTARCRAVTLPRCETVEIRRGASNYWMDLSH